MTDWTPDRLRTIMWRCVMQGSGDKGTRMFTYQAEADPRLSMTRYTVHGAPVKVSIFVSGKLAAEWDKGAATYSDLAKVCDALNDQGAMNEPTSDD